MNLNISDKLNQSNDEEEQKIKNLVNEIYQYESKIELINNELKKSTNDIYQNIKIKDLNITKELLNVKIINLNVSLKNSQSIYNNLLQQKESLMIELDEKIKKFKKELSKKDIIKFNSVLMIKYIISNNSNDNFLSEEQINDIINDNQKLINNNNKRYILNNEINIINEILLDISNKEIKIKFQIDEINELLDMLKEEKITTNKELINLISYKETIDTILKINIHNLATINDSETGNSNNPINYNIDNENNNEWIKTIKLYYYEFSILNSADLAKALCDNIFSIFDINNENIVINNENIEYGKEKYKDSNFFNKNIINNSTFEDNNFSNISSILPREKYNNKNIINNLIKNEFDKFLKKKDKNIENFLENISNILISKNDYLFNNNISKNNFIIYLSYFLKSFYYQNMIETKLIFINKDYKLTKKENKQKLNQLITILDNYKNNKISLNNRINHNKEQIKLLDDNKEIANNLKITKDEENYIKICKEGNQLIMQKNKINDIILLYKDKIKEQENLINNEIKELKNKVDNINEEVNDINKIFENEKIKANEKIIENRKIISQKYDKIKNIFNCFKNKHGNNLLIYNKLLNSINETLINKNRNSNLIKSLNNINYDKEKYENNNSKELVNFELNISNIEKVSTSKDKDSDLTLKRLNSLKFTTKSYNNKRNIIQNYQYNDSNSNSLFYKPNNNKKDYFHNYSKNYNFKKNIKDYIFINDNLSHNYGGVIEIIKTILIYF